MSIYDSFTKRNSLIKTLQFRLKPVYNTQEKLLTMGMLAKDRERSECWPVVIDVLRRVDNKFIEKVLTNDVELDWQPLAEALDKAKLTKNNAVLVRRQAEMRKAVSRLLTGHKDYKNLVNPSKAIKMAAAAAENDTEACAIAKFLRFTTVLESYFAHKKVVFGYEDKKTAIAYRLVHDNFPIYLKNLLLLKQYAAAGLLVPERFFKAGVNGYNACLLQRQIDDYNQAMGQINKQLRALYADKKLPPALKSVPFRLSLLQKQILSSNELKNDCFAGFSQMQEAVCALQKRMDTILSVLRTAYEKCVNIDSLNKFKEQEAAVLASAKCLTFKEDDEKSIISIKAFLDTVLELRRFIKGILQQGAQKNHSGLQELLAACDEVWEELEVVPNLYNRIRWFLTRKPYNKDKIRLFFDCAAFGRGWDVNKEAAYLLTFFKRERLYYLGIRRQGVKIDFSKLADAGCAHITCYEKMVYKAFDFVKGMPAIVFSKTVLQKFVDGANEVVLDNKQFSRPFVVTRADFEQKYFVKEGILHELAGEQIKYLPQYLMKTGDEIGYRAELERRIELAKRFIATYKAFQFFDMSHLREAEDYASWTDFLIHVNGFTYGVSWQKIPEKVMEQLVDVGDLFLFQLDNKDFAYNRTIEQQDEQTLLLRTLFSDINKEKRVLKLLGNVEVYYRPASIKHKLIHKQGSIVVNKKDSAHGALSAELVRNVYKYMNGKTQSLLPEAAALLAKGKIRYKEAERDIIKDKRYTEEQMFVHIPVGINYRCANNDYSCNKDMRVIIKNNPLVNILAVHLGEHNLAEVVILDAKGNTIYEKVYNEFNQYDYYKALALRADERVQAQKNWLQMEKIKNIQLGYTGALVNEICQLLIKYNAVAVLEDFSHNKKSHPRKALQNMQFALSLLRKLNYLVFKDKQSLEPGGILNGYMLAPKVTSLSSFANQIGCVFFVLPEREQLGVALSKAQLLALKGSILIRRIKEADDLDKVDLMLTVKQWHQFLEQNRLMK